MKIVAIADTHCRHRSLKVPKADVLVHAGDVSYRGMRSEVVDFLDWFGEQPHRYKIFVAGNHDFFFEKEKESVIKQLIPSSVHYLKDETLTIEGIKFWGSPYTPQFYQWAFNKRRGGPMAMQWDKIPADTDVLLTHGPPYGILDVTLNEQHAGDKDLLARILHIKPAAHIYGHMHESHGTVKRHGINFVNACILNEAYELVNKPIVFEVLQNSQEQENFINV